MNNIENVEKNTSNELKKTGFAAGIWLPDETEPALVVVPNIKTQTAIWKFIEENRNKIRHTDDDILRFKEKNFIPPKTRYWIISELKRLDGIRRVKEGLPNTDGRTPKPDKFGLPGGIIESWEIYPPEIAVKRDEYGTSDAHYSEIAFCREWLEEARCLVVQETETKGITKRTSLYEREVMFWEDDYNNPADDHEDYFFRVKGIEGELGKFGYEGETGPPEIVAIDSLNRGNFYNKHAEPLAILLSRLIKDYGYTRLEPALKHIWQKFDKSSKLRREPKIRVPNDTILSDDKLWEYMTKGVKKINND